MFTHETHLRHLLRPDQYTSEEQYRAELRHLFLPAWHPLGTIRDLARPGDFLTFDLLETPILIRNFDGEPRAFLNVCPHRHSKLTEKPRGNTPKLRCRYHGWEFNGDGRTGRIPDAKAFRPWDRENSCLKPFRLERCGDLLFVNLSDTGVSLRDWLGPLWEPWQDYGGVYRHVATWEQEFPCNWKVVLENSLESYHIPEVHPYTFKEFSKEEVSWHELHETYTTYKTIPPNDLAGRITDWMVRRLGQPNSYEYWHRVRHPHVTGASLDPIRMMQAVFPTGPTTCRYRSIFFTLRGPRRGPFAWAFSRFFSWISTMVAHKVFAEDATIYGGVQKGMAASPHPGVIGTREERIYYFQEFVNRECGGPRELPVLAERESPAKPQVASS
jgi:phenylpropionate dioxygenase-like ring-hydroxylating dioxygenase large terminal subunit